ncbi:glycosyltransferase family 4 protein [Macellibacteroides fermentans]|uniref:glycosyltransferase family 4 protein n=1 Tax=Macellibacteroides fermentans TaxID=879969 RepID=UPI00406CE097
MNIIVSADSFSSFTSGFPVRGMMLELIKMRSNDTFHLYYTKRNIPNSLTYFYNEINHLANIELHYYPYSQKEVELRRMFRLNTIKESNKYDFFINPGRIECLPNFNGPQICSVADLSMIKGISTGKYNLFFRNFNKFEYPRVFNKLTKIVSISNYTKNDILSYWPQFRDKTTVVYNGIDNFWFDDNVERFNTGVESEYFIWWGLISRRKNIENLILAYNKAKESEPNLPKLLLVGGIQEHMHYITKYFDDSIVNIPFQDNYTLKYLVRNSRGLIFPSLYEGFGLPVIEAFSQGVPVACSNVTSLIEVAGENAILFDPNNVGEIFKSILSLKQARNNKEVLKGYASRFTYAEAAKQYSKIIDSLV